MFSLPRPVSPRSMYADLKLMFARDRPHRWGLLGVSAAITFVLMWGFTLESRKPAPERQITYINTWMSDRKDSDIIRQQIKDLDTYEMDLRQLQGRWQKFADAAGIEWRKEEAENRAIRNKDRAAMKKILEKKLADALVREAAEARTASKTDGAQPATIQSSPATP
ncbi:MAG: hypothetical protein J7494_13210 [Sphingobium sp.]|nr:hypothetical protein [Sphingobium sp.]